MNIKNKIATLLAIENEKDAIMADLFPLIEKYCGSAKRELERVHFDNEGIYWETQTCSCCNDPKYWGLTWDYFDDPDAYITKEKQKKLDEEAAEQLEKQKAQEEYDRRQFEVLKKKLNL